MKRLLAVLFVLATSALALGAEIHVAIDGDDAGSGSADSPLRTISAAAEIAQPGDVITVHEGTYREWVSPPRGGTSDDNRIVYRAAPGEHVEIKGSEVVDQWTHIQGDVWKAVLPNSFFGDFNPYADLIHGDWFHPKGREHHTGAVYLNGDWLTEAAALDDVLEPVGETPLWFAEVDEQNTTIWAQFPGADPNEELVEINTRRAVFYPRKPGRNYITLRGFTLRHAATPWAPPTAEQIGLVGTHWSKGWIIEDNRISHSVCTGITLGKHGDEYDNTSANTAEGYVETIRRGLARGWSRENIGHHVVSNNVISHCEQAGIVGSLGAAFSVVTDNTIHDIHVRRLFTGAEMAGIKFHAPIDSRIARNHIYRTCRGLWLDWMAQGTRVSSNLFHDNDEDLFVEVNHGPFVVDNNLFLSRLSLRDMSEGGAYAHNLFAGMITVHPELNRQTPYHPAHSTEIAGLSNIAGGDNRFYNNLFLGPREPSDKPQKPAQGQQPWITGFGLAVYDAWEMTLTGQGNVYCGSAHPSEQENEPLLLPPANPAPQLQLEDGGVTLTLGLSPHLGEADTVAVTTELLGKTTTSGLPYEDFDGSPLEIDTDYFGDARSEDRPAAGPFAAPEAGTLELDLR